jgi:hypothetical protein
MRYAKFYTAILLGIMVLNTGKYQLPYIQYNLFKNYIAENLCIKRNETNNLCHGKCFLEKQINLVDETEDNSNSPVAKKQIKGIDDYVIKEVFLQKPNPYTTMLLLLLTDTRITKISLDIHLPPPKRFIIIID